MATITSAPVLASPASAFMSTLGSDFVDNNHETITEQPPSAPMSSKPVSLPPGAPAELEVTRETSIRSELTARTGLSLGYSSSPSVQGLGYSSASSSIPSTLTSVKTPMTVSKNVMALDLNSPFVPVKPCPSAASSVKRKDVINNNDYCVVKPVAQQLPPSVNHLVVHSMQQSTQWALSGGIQNQQLVVHQGGLLPTQHNALVLHSARQAPGGYRTRTEPPETDIVACVPGRDPPGESPTARPTVDHHGRYRKIQWADPRAVLDEADIDYTVLRQYEQLAGHVTTEEELAMDPARIRIATISSGYKKANFFVREDLDQRIYFHDLEDAVSYMARRGYARMRKEEENQWKKLLVKAHQVVKVGPTKKKQRYRKGKLVLIMKKMVVDDSLFSGSSDISTAATSHTSIGRSIRAGYKSYSEKFLAEQEQEKRLLLTGEAPRLRLTNGPVDPEPLLQITNGNDEDEEDDDEDDEDEDEDEDSRASSSQSSQVSEARIVSYGGGVRYFTPDSCYSVDADESEQSEQSTFEDESASEVDDSTATSAESGVEDDSTYSNGGDESTTTSSTSSEMSSIVRHAQGVRMTGKYGNKSTLNHNRAPTPFDKKSVAKHRSASTPPDMAPVSSDSEDSY